MKSKWQWAGAVLAIAGLTAAGGAAAANTAADQAGAMPPQQHQGQVGFVSGGIGEGQAKLFEQQAAKHRLEVAVFEKAGKVAEFTADARIRIADAHGLTVLDTTAQGPFVLVDVPPGSYTVAATLHDRTMKKQGVRVAASGPVARATFEFPHVAGG